MTYSKFCGSKRPDIDSSTGTYKYAQFDSSGDRLLKKESMRELNPGAKCMRCKFSWDKSPLTPYASGPLMGWLCDDCLYQISLRRPVPARDQSSGS